MCHPATSTHASLTQREAETMGVTPGLLRISVGLEDTLRPPRRPHRRARLTPWRGCCASTGWAAPGRRCGRSSPRSVRPATTCSRRRCPGHGSTPADLRRRRVGRLARRRAGLAGRRRGRPVDGWRAGAGGRRRRGVPGRRGDQPAGARPDAVDGLEWRLSRGHEWVEDAPTFPGEIAYTRLPIVGTAGDDRAVSPSIDLAAVTAAGAAGVEPPRRRRRPRRRPTSSPRRSAAPCAG